MGNQRRYLIALCFIASVLPLDGRAQALQASPITVEFLASESASDVTLQNPGDQPLFGQVRILRWDQVNGDDELNPTNDLIASPPIVEIAPRANQLIRLVRVKSSSPATEQYYRLIVDELPQPDAAPMSGVKIRLRYSLPVFIEPAGPVGQASLAWHLARSGQGWILRVDNNGNRRAQIAATELVSGQSKAYEISKGLLGYVLANRSRQWRISLPADADIQSNARIRTRVGLLSVEAPISVEASDKATHAAALRVR